MKTSSLTAMVKLGTLPFVTPALQRSMPGDRLRFAIDGRLEPANCRAFVPLGKGPLPTSVLRFAAVVGREICSASAVQIGTTKQRNRKGDKDETSESRPGKTGTAHRPRPVHRRRHRHRWWY